MDKGRTHRTVRGLAVLASSSFLALAAVGTATAHPLVADTRDDDATAGDNLAALICTYDDCDDVDELASRIDQLLGGFTLIDESTDASSDQTEDGDSADSAESDDHAGDSETEDSSDNKDEADHESEQHDSGDAEDDSNDSEDQADDESEQHDSGDAEDDSSDTEDHAGSDSEDHDSGDTEDGGDSNDD